MSEELSSNISDRVTRLEQNLDRFIDAVSQNHRDHEVQLRSQQSQINALTDLTRQLTQTQLEMFTRFDQMQSEIIGLRTETRRILDRFLNEPPDEEEDNN